MRRTEGGGIVRVFAWFMATLGVVAMLCVVGYLLSEINARRYRLAVADDGIVVERGRYAPLGFERYQPFDEVLRQAYAPIALPPGETIDVGVVYDERSEVDRALFSRLRTWATSRLQATDAPTLELGIAYVKRLEVLPGLSEEQRHDLRGMRADAALKQGEGLLRGVHQALKQAERLFEQAIELGAVDSERARKGLAECGHKLSVLQSDPNAQPTVPALWPKGAGGDTPLQNAAP